MASLATEVSEHLNGSTFLQCRQLKERSLILFFSEGKLQVSLAMPLLRFHLTQKRSPLKETPFTQKLERHLENRTLVSAQLAHSDRILELLFDSGKRLVAELIPRRPKLLLLAPSAEVLASLDPHPDACYQIPEKPRHEQQEGISVSSKEIEERFDLLEAKMELTRFLSKGISRERKRLKRLGAELERALDWEALQREAELLVSHFHLLKRGQAEVTVQDWYAEGKPVVISLKPNLTPEQNIAKRFKESRSRKAGIPYLKELITKCKSQCQALEESRSRCEEAKTLSAIAAIRESIGFEEAPKLKRKQARERLPYREFCTAAGLKVWVGRAARDNERLTFSLARGNDLWMHVRDYPGSHVIVRLERSAEADRESVLDALQLSLYFSRARQAGSAEVVLTRVKYVRKLKGGPLGQVSLSKHQVEAIKEDKERLQRLLHNHSNSGSASRKR